MALFPQAIQGGTRPTGFGGAHKEIKWLFFVTVGSVCSRWRSTVTDGRCWQIHFTRHFSYADEPRLKCLHACVIPSPWNPWWVFDCLLRLFFVLTHSVCLSFTLLFSSHFNLYSDLNSFHVDNAKANILCVSANWGVLLSGRIHSSHRLWAQAPWRLPLLGDSCSDLPGGIRRQRYGALVLVWLASSVIFRTLKNGETRAQT